MALLPLSDPEILSQLRRELQTFQKRNPDFAAKWDKYEEMKRRCAVTAGETIYKKVIKALPEGVVAKPKEGSTENRCRSLANQPHLTSQIKTLDLEKCNPPLGTLPRFIGIFRNLQSLYLQGNLLTFPSGILVLANLEELDLSQNEIQEIPSEIGLMKKIQKLGLGENQLCSLPSTMKELTQLTHLDLSKNRFEKFPGVLIKIQTLEHLYLVNNQISSVPQQIRSVRVLKLEGNPLT